jgi:NAD+ kinase
LEDRFALERRMMLQAAIQRMGDLHRSEEASGADDGLHDHQEIHWALNDLYLKPYHEDLSPTCILEMEIDGEVVDQVRGDGLDFGFAYGLHGLRDGGGRPDLASRD